MVCCSGRYFACDCCYQLSRGLELGNGHRLHRVNCTNAAAAFYMTFPCSHLDTCAINRMGLSSEAPGKEQQFHTVQKHSIGRIWCLTYMFSINIKICATPFYCQCLSLKMSFLCWKSVFFCPPCYFSFSLPSFRSTGSSIILQRSSPLECCTRSTLGIIFLSDLKRYITDRDVVR